MNSNIKSAFTLTPCQLSKTEEAYTGFLYTSHDTYKKIRASYKGKDDVFVMVNGFIYILKPVSLIINP